MIMRHSLIIAILSLMVVCCSSKTKEKGSATSKADKIIASLDTMPFNGLEYNDTDATDLTHKIDILYLYYIIASQEGKYGDNIKNAKQRSKILERFSYSKEDTVYIYDEVYWTSECKSDQYSFYMWNSNCKMFANGQLRAYSITDNEMTNIYKKIKASEKEKASKVEKINNNTVDGDYEIASLLFKVIIDNKNIEVIKLR